MEPTEALAELTTLSSQIVEAAILGESGFVLASTGSPERGEQLARVAADLRHGGRGRPAGAEVTRVEVRQPSGSVFVVVEGGTHRRRHDGAGADGGPRPLRPADSLRRLDEAPARRSRSGSGVQVRRLFWLAVAAAVAWWLVNRRRSGADDVGATIGYADGSAVTFEHGLAGARPPARHRRRGEGRVIDDLGALLVEHALLEGDFVLRSGKRSTWYLDKYRFETRPDLLRGARRASRGGRP